MLCKCVHIGTLTRQVLGTHTHVTYRHTPAHTHTHTRMHACKHTPTPPPSSFLLIHCGCWEGSRRRVQSHGGRLGLVEEGSPCGMVHRNFLPVGKLGCMSLFTRSIHLGEVLPCGLFFPLGLHFKSCFWGIHRTLSLHGQTTASVSSSAVLQLAGLQSSTPSHPHTLTPSHLQTLTPTHQPPTCYVRIVEKEGNSSLYLVHITVFTYIRAYVHLLKGHHEMEHGLCM